MKKKLLIGALVFSASLLVSGKVLVMPVEHRVLASEVTGQVIENKINLTVEANGYKTVKLTELTHDTSGIDLTDNADDKYKYAWVENPKLYNNVNTWKNLPSSESTSASPYILVKDAEEGKYLIIKKEDEIIFCSNDLFNRHSFKPTVNILKQDDKDNFFISLGNEAIDFEYKEKISGQADNSDEGWQEKQGSGLETEVESGVTKIFLFRLKGTGYSLASAEKEITVKNLIESEKVWLDDLKKLSFTLKETEDGVFLDIEGLNSLSSKKSDLTYVISYADRDEEEKEIKYKENNHNKVEISVDSNLSLALKSDGIKVLSFNFVKHQLPDLKQKGNEKVIQGFQYDLTYQKEENGDYQDLNGIQGGLLSVDDFGIFKLRIKGNFGKLDIQNATVGDPIMFMLPSDPKEVVVKKTENYYPPSVYFPDDSNDSSLESEETKKLEEKKEEKQEEKAVEEPKVEEPKTEEPKTEEAVKPVTETVKAAKKTSVAVASKKIDSILKADAGKLSISVKNATVTLPKGVLETVFAEEAGSLKVSVKTVLPKEGGKDEKAIEKRLKKNTLLSKDIYHLSVKVGKESLNQYDLNGEKFTVTLQTKLKNAPKKLYVMNLSNGKLIKVKFKAGKVTFKTELAGKFVLVTK